MITRLGNHIAGMLVASRMISAEDRELYGYGFFLILSGGLYLTIAIALGAIFGVLRQSVLFYLLFSILREYTGGVHASTEWGCMLSTTASFTLSVIAIRIFNQVERPTAAVTLLLAGCTVVFLLSPLDTPQKPLPAADRQHYRHISCRLGVTYLLLGTVSATTGCIALYPITLATTLSSTLLLLGAVKLQWASRKASH